MAEIRTRAGKAQSLPLPAVSITAPEQAMFISAEQISQDLPVDAITCCITRAQGVAHCLWHTLNERDLDPEAGAVWALIGLIGEIDRLVTFAADAGFSSTSTEGGKHA